MSSSKSILIFFLAALFVGSFGAAYLKNSKESIKGEKEEIVLPEVKDYSPTQYILLSFDGSQSVPMWKATTDFAREMKQIGKPLKFTYFISGVYFLPDTDRKIYEPPRAVAGTSRIGFGGKEEDIKIRVEAVNQAIDDGHEIASHLNGHFDGTKWNKLDWEKEFSMFNTLLEGKLNISPSSIAGVRTPNLGRNKDLYKVLAENGYVYDASGVGRMGDWPQKDENGIWEIPLVSLTLAGTRLTTLSMDYNLYLTQTGGKEAAPRGSKTWSALEQQVLNSYRNYFNYNYSHGRAPVVIGHHFSQWNSGVYWEAMKEFAREECGKVDVKCATFSELTKYLEVQATKTPEN